MDASDKNENSGSNNRKEERKEMLQKASEKINDESDCN
jgi:hypothetical protein